MLIQNKPEGEAMGWSFKQAEAEAKLTPADLLERRISCWNGRWFR
jgi:hypothetical protein